MEKISYLRATELLSAVRLLKRHISFFDARSIDLCEFESSLDRIYGDLFNYRKKLKKDAYSNI